MFFSSELGGGATNKPRFIVVVRHVGERTFRVRGLTLASKEWGDAESMPIIALHGWLDNAASFDLMLAQMSGIHAIAVDSAGHGRSDFRSQDAGYDIWREISDVIEIADQMDWQQFALVGHSRGAVVAGLVAGAFPERISDLVLIDCHMPVPVEAHNSAKQVAKSIRDDKRFSSSLPSYFDTYEKAVQARADGFLALQVEAAHILAKRGVRECDKGFYWHNDQRLKGTASIQLTEDQIKSFLGAIEASTLLIYAKQSIFTKHDQHTHLSAWMTNTSINTLPGTHHLHMEDQSGKVAMLAQKFLTQPHEDSKE